MRIHILALNGVFDTGLAAVLDAFGTANALAEMTGITSLRFRANVRRGDRGAVARRFFRRRKLLTTGQLHP